MTELASGWMVVILTLADWACHDVSRYVPNGYLEFNVKGEIGGEQFIIGAVDHVSERSSGIEHTITKPITDYCTVTDEWQHIKIPLKDILAPSLDMDPYNAKAIVLDKVANDPFCVWINQLKLTSPDKEDAFPAIKVNQAGFRESSEKYAYVTGFEDDFNAAAGTRFQVMRVSDNSVAYSGNLILITEYDANDSGEMVLKAVFTDLEQPGDYYITVNADDIDASPRFLAAGSLYRATGEAKYNNYFVANYSNGKDAYENPTGDWVGMWNFAFFSYMKANNRNSNAVNWFRDEFTIWVNNKIDRYQTSAWGNIIANGNYYWGSNSQILGVCMEAVIGSRLLGTNTDTIDNMALSSLNWILGANPMRKSFVSGYGDDCIKTIFGTFNDDGNIDIVDALLVARYYVGLITSFPCSWTLSSIVFFFLY